MTNLISALALVVSALSLVVSWRVGRANARHHEPLIWLSFQGFEQQPEWWYATLHIRNRSAAGIQIDKVIAKGKTRLSSYRGPIIGGKRWQFDDAVRDAPLVKELPLGDQRVWAFPGEDGASGIILRSSSSDVVLKLVGRTIEAVPKSIRFRVKAQLHEGE
ncbi:MAG: hypothetical protein J0I54_12670 [Bosea sp.]|uniref:hypothetical protein n=1 Tax=unclassified Bosea (in: a-proteobacteria) TaxID=2653178 RepID=UPI000963F4CF|nr:MULTISPECIES: hypothetical protein [unclassified Bosea (in: a-proteobacteria)]MBN9457474.1 hypothetical protein [Bosea sp. (in: a-proteobacteria)]OJV09559.1 MAG: hypothetical protein BGO20_02445 [Bosea sp. 67-29]